MKKNKFQSPEEENIQPISLTDGSFDPFELRSGSASTLGDPDGVIPLDLSRPNLDEERFPLKKEAVDPKHQLGIEGEILLHTQRTRAPKTPFRYPAIATAVALLLFLLWIVFGFIYTRYYNAELYSKFHRGINPEMYNEGFDFFLTLDGTTSPVVRSERAHYVKSFNGIPMVPGTLTSTEAEGVYTVTGSASLLPDISTSLVGKTVTLESTVLFEEYVVTDVSKVLSGKPDLIIYVGSSSRDIQIISAKRSTPSQ